MLSLNNLTGFNVTGATGTPQALGEFFAWGDNTKGQAGPGDFTTPIVFPTNTDTTDDISISSASHYRALHMGYLINNVLSTAGDNGYGQLGLGDEDDRNLFTVVTVPVGGTITSLAFGRFHSLTVRNGKVNGCGRNNIDQLTSGVPTSNLFGIIVQPNDIEGADAVKVYASELSSAVLTSDNKVFTWGRQIGSLSGSANSNPEPFDIAEFLPSGNGLVGKDIMDFAMGTYHALALTSDGEVYSMAHTNSYGQAGNGNTGSEQLITLVFSDTTKIACGETSSYLISNSKLYGCGRGDSGQLGTITAQDNPLFVELDPSITDWIDVQAGQHYVIAKRQDGSLYHSGDNSFAQQGNGTESADVFGFVKIAGPPDQSYTSFAAGRRTVYGLS